MNCKSTRVLLKMIPGFPCLYRHDLNEFYYGIAKVRGNRKERSLGAADGKVVGATSRPSFRTWQKSSLGLPVAELQRDQL
ncbi:hypothetical protein [Prosthecobacter sp.]|uniref:hypothetical protein n=1 Tax=Prosthecobacter sp. TaxID=1965333 RepID=UPI002626FBDB|nr:hypothetical protein [Prosthecobacter sp.]